MQSIAEILDESHWDSVLRELAERSDWFLPMLKDSRAALWTIDGVCHWAAQSDKTVPADGEFAWLEMRGRHLLSVIPDEVQRMIFDWGKPNSLLVEGAALARLRSIASGLDAEDALRMPGLKSGVDSLLKHRWLVLNETDAPAAISQGGLQSICAFSAVDSLVNYVHLEPEKALLSVRLIVGQDLFDQLNARSDWDCLWINPHGKPAFTPFAPAAVYELTQKREPQEEGKILKARSIAEIHRFLDERGMNQDGRDHAIEYIGETMVARYSGETFTGESLSFSFYPVSESGSEIDWGSGATEILCTGLLADVLRRRLTMIEEEQDLPDNFIRVTAFWAHELIKTMGQTDSELSRRTQRTADGARFVREFPQIKTRSFMIGAIESCENILREKRPSKPH